ncbi:hypothetical protein SKZ59_07270 [Janthinobacterium sp. GMG2]|uniref:hypothetical protein n=1 Tax=Janthinobacterium sp. GMG2 TaxID=3096606 RepID=UPI0029F5B9E3|nr:hypothetical protein [Janthinobacterium sp. GMG2]MDX8121563.1 hypothetical protein [Janthinobacterium sp. GMG2]
MNRKIFNLTKLEVLGAFLLLSGCGTILPASVHIEVPVMVPCVGEVPLRPAYEFDKLAPDMTDGEIVLALARDWPRGRKYEEELVSIVAGCTLLKH